MAVRTEMMYGAPTREQAERGEATHTVVAQLTNYIQGLPSFREATALSFFAQSNAEVVPSRPQCNSVTFRSGGKCYQVVWSQDMIDGHGFNPNGTLIRTHFELARYVGGESQYPQIDTSAELEYHTLKDRTGRSEDVFTGGNVRLRTDFLPDVTNLNAPWKSARPSVVIEGADAIVALPRSFSEFYHAE